MKIGISTACMYPMLTEKSLELMQSLGYDVFEIFVNSFSEVEHDYIDTIKSMLKDNGSELISLHPFISGDEPYLLFSDYYRRFVDSVDFYDRFFKCAAFWGAKYVILHGDRRTSINGISDIEYFERFAILAKHAQSFGVMLLQENVNAYRSQSVDFIAKMKDYLGDVALFNLDVKQTVRAGQDLTQMCLAMGKNLRNVHISDNLPGEDCLLPGLGNMDYKAFFELLKSVKYDGACLIEVYSRNITDNAQLIKSGKYLESFIE